MFPAINPYLHTTLSHLVIVAPLHVTYSQGLNNANIKKSPEKINVQDLRLLTDIL